MLYEPETRYLLQERLILLAMNEEKKTFNIFRYVSRFAKILCAEQHSDSLEEVAWV